MPNKHLIHFKFNRELSELYITHVVKSFAMALIGVFVPAYLIKLGYSLQSVLLFYIYIGICSLFLMIFVTKIYSKIGLKHSILFSIPFYIVYFLLLYSLETYAWPLFLIAFVTCLACAFYWPAFHIEFIKASDSKHRGEELGIMNFVSQIGIIFAPAIGGLVIYFLGFKVLFGFVAALLLFAPIPLFFSKEVYTKVRFSFKNVFHKDHLRNFFVFFVEGIVSHTENVIWVIFIFLVLNSFLSLGFLATLIVLFTAVATFVIGRLSDVINKRNIMKAGIFSSSAGWFLKTMAQTIFHFGFFNFLFGIFFTMVNVPYMALFYNKASRSHPAEFVVFREIGLSLGRIMIILFVLLTGSFIGSFIIAGFSSLAFLLF